MFDIVDLAVQEPEGIIVTITLWHTTGLNAWPYREFEFAGRVQTPHVRQLFKSVKFSAAEV